MKAKNYFDYKLAYDGFNEFKRVFEQVEVSKLDEYFQTEANLSNLDSYNYISFHLPEYNCFVDIYKNNLNEWKVLSDVEILSSSGDTDNIYIDSPAELMDRIEVLLNWPVDDRFSKEDKIKTVSSINEVLADLSLKYKSESEIDL